ncbi:MAG: SPOR domain-containing protein, partial [Pararhodobacter sp.]|nr:SPOR domain-containing protein [Pararhodobacter sp.]
MSTAGPAAPVDGGVPQQVAGPGQRVIERDVEAPDVFQVEDAGLWDGRPSLGGVWVAHPGVQDPERAMIRNTVTGATVIGALFRRERDNPGPRFQVSSEAANALGLLPGAPT